MPAADLIGKSISIARGAFKGHEATVKRVAGDIIYADTLLFGRPTELTLSWRDVFDEPFISPPSRPLDEILRDFDALYREKAPLRYAQLRDGLTRPTIEAARNALDVDALPDDYITMYSWNDGLENPDDGWPSEFDEDLWFELVPLDRNGHLIGLNDAIGLVEMWRDIAGEAREEGWACYWKPGFIPFIEVQNYALVVIDTVGYWGGKPNQIVSFDFKTGNGYQIVAENLAKWWQMQLRRLQADVLFEIDSRIADEVNGYYTRQFPDEIPLDDP